MRLSVRHAPGPTRREPPHAHAIRQFAVFPGWQQASQRYRRDQVAYRRVSPLGVGSANARFWNPAKQMPCQQPPWAELMAVNANTGDIAWRVPLGVNDELEAKGVHNTGAFGQGGPISTGGGLTFIAGTVDKRFRAFDSATGKVVWETKLDAEGHTNPMTYMGRNGKQYVVMFSSGVNAFALE